MKTGYTPTAGLSRRAYAARRGVTVRSVQKRVEDGTLSRAMTTDGKIDPDIADSLLAAGTTGTIAATGLTGSSSLAEARRRKAAAGNALLRDDLEELEGSVVTRDIAAECERACVLPVATRLLLLPRELAPAVAGKPAAIVATLLDEAVIAALTEISEMDVAGGEEPANEGGEEFPLGHMSLVELTAMKANLLAQRLEIQRNIRKHKMVRVADIKAALISRLQIVKTALLGVHHKLAPSLAMTSAADARKILNEELDEIVSALAGPAVSLNELRAAATNSVTKTKLRKTK